MSAREAILQRLRAAPRGHALTPPDVRRFDQGERSLLPASSRATRIELFCEKMAVWRGEVIRVTAHDWPIRLRQLCAAKGVRSLLYGAQTAHAPALVATGRDGLLAYERPANEWKQALFDSVDASLTSTRGAIAETGTLILWPDAKEPRLMSLVPPIHFALLDAGCIYDTFLDVIADQRWADGLPSNALLVSGPSKTADIQVTLAYGAHGPKRLIVLLLVDEGDA